MNKKYCEANRAFNNALSADPTVAVAALLAKARSRGEEGAEFMACTGLLIMGFNMMYQCKAEGRPAEEIAKEWGDAILALSRKAARLTQDTD